MHTNLTSTVRTPHSALGRWMLALGCSLLSFATTALAQSAAWVTTDAPDYPPGGTVYITGGGFGTNEIVTCQVLHIPDTGDNNTSTNHQPWTVTADDAGNISTTWGVPLDEDELGATLQLSATGQTSALTAQTTFTDASLVIGNNSVSAATVCAGSTSIPIHSFSVIGGGNPNPITDISFTTTGTYA